jgi:hypothetical protein
MTAHFLAPAGERRGLKRLVENPSGWYVVIDRPAY